MEPVLFPWTETAMNIIEIAALGAILWQLIRLRREITALVRVVRRMDRKTGDTKSGPFVSQAETERVRMRATGVGQ